MILDSSIKESQSLKPYIYVEIITSRNEVSRMPVVIEDIQDIHVWDYAGKIRTVIQMNCPIDCAFVEVSLFRMLYPAEEVDDLLYRIDEAIENHIGCSIGMIHENKFIRDRSRAIYERKESEEVYY